MHLPLPERRAVHALELDPRHVWHSRLVLRPVAPNTTSAATAGTTRGADIAIATLVRQRLAVALGEDTDRILPDPIRPHLHHHTMLHEER